MSASHHLSLNPTPRSPASQPDDLASLSVVRYLDAADLGTVNVKEGGSRWNWLTGALLIGALFGFGVNLCFDVKEATVPQHLARVSFGASTQTVVPVPYNSQTVERPAQVYRRPATSSSELEAIKLRNRRLEALVKVLRQRSLDSRRGASTSPPG